MLRISNTTAAKCAVDKNFNAKSIRSLPGSNSYGILQERRKRIFDVTIASLLLLFLLPVLLVIAVAVKLTSKGPALFTQSRYGRFKKEFLIVKFRTMTVMENGENFTQAARNDARITPLGAFLRQTSLDELPQLWNVIKGDMSLVGPRPHAIAMDDEFAKHLQGYDRRFLMRPGITGLAQCTGFRGETRTMQQIIGRLCRDIYYVRNRTMLMDIKILASTLAGLLKHDAY